MNASDLDGSPIGSTVVVDGGMRAFVPAALPETLDLPPSVQRAIERATIAVATLSGVGETLENPRLLVAPFLRREAVLSSRIEGTQASLSDLLELEAQALPKPGDAREVLNYVVAVEQGIHRLETLPVSVRLINEMHEVLMRGVRGDEGRPGAFREQQVYIGAPGTPIQQARFIPPPPGQVADLMAGWERWLNTPREMQILARCALLHYQFEAIHPYRDGNGRIGRALITLFLIAEGLLTRPLLYVSAFFERHRADYYEHLLRISQTGDWLPWLMFFAAGVEEQALDAIRRSRDLRDLRQEYLQRLQAANASANAFALLDLVFRRPRLTRRAVAVELGVTTTGARSLVERLVELGVLTPVPNRRPALFTAPDVLEAIGG